MAKVEFNMENLKKCVCRDCPVQENSECASSKKKMVQEKMEEMMNKGMMPDPEAVPGVYCATGRAICEDLDFDKMCMCASCPVWQECDLGSGSPMGYFCRDGSSQ
ncbi:MAG: hypothetical protein ACP5C3_04730 [Methanomicrobiales archaeon]